MCIHAASSTTSPDTGLWPKAQNHARLTREAQQGVRIATAAITIIICHSDKRTLGILMTGLHDAALRSSEITQATLPRPRKNFRNGRSRQRASQGALPDPINSTHRILPAGPLALTSAAPWFINQ
jgi:hypothetical protein